MTDTSHVIHYLHVSNYLEFKRIDEPGDCPDSKAWHLCAQRVFALVPTLALCTSAEGRRWYQLVSTSMPPEQSQGGANVFDENERTNIIAGNDLHLVQRLTLDTLPERFVYSPIINAEGTGVSMRRCRMMFNIFPRTCQAPSLKSQMRH